jgi:hypothetical protein
MKKLSILMGVVMSSVILLSGCNLFGLAGTVDEVTGILEKQDSTDEQSGTHLITDEDGEVYALNSTALNLSSQQYIGNIVKVNVGYDKENEVYSVTGVSVVEVLEKDGGKSNWISYMNQDVGFSWKFYDNWDVIESDTSVKLLAPTQLEGVELDEDTSIGLTPDTVLVERRERGEDKTFDEFIEFNGLGLFGRNAAEDYNVSEAKVGANMQSAIKWDLKAGTDVHYFLERDNYIYNISFYALEAGGDDSNLRAFHEMLLEFKFVPFEGAEELPIAEDEIEEDDTPSEPIFEPEELMEDEPEAEAAPVSSLENDHDYSSYSEFESLPYHFAAKYPASWYYSGASGTEDGVLHKYGFSDEAVTDENEFASLKVLSGGIPNGHSLDLPNGMGRKVYDLPMVTIYVEIEDILYSAEGPKEIEETLIQIISSITPVETE